MRTIEAGEDVRPLPLLEALQAADIPVAMVHPDGRVVLDVAEDDDTHDAAVAAIVAAHDTAAIDAAEALRRKNLRDAATLLKAHYARATSTNAQNTEAVKALSLLMREVVAELRDA